MTDNLYETLLECLRDAPRKPWQAQRIVLSGAMLTALATAENERRASQASDHYKPPPPLDPETLNPAEVRIFGLPIRVDDTVAAPDIEIIDDTDCCPTCETPVDAITRGRLTPNGPIEPATAKPCGHVLTAADLYRMRRVR